MAGNIWTRFRVHLNAASASATLDILCDLPTSSFPQIINAAICATRPYLFNLFHRYYMMSFFHQGVVSITPLLIAFLQLKYQGNQENPFATHPNTMAVAVFASFMYYLTYTLQLRPCIRRFSPVSLSFLWHCMVWFGDFSVASLVSVFFPDRISPFVYGLFVLPLAIELLHWVCRKLFAERRRQDCGN